MNRKQKIIVSVTGIFLVLLILVGLTYAYFLTQITGNTNPKSISVTTANLQVKYEDGTNIIFDENTKIIPSANVIGEKTFNVVNNGDPTEYVIIIENVIVKNATTEEYTTFESNDFVYDLSCSIENVSPVRDILSISNKVLPMGDSQLSETINIGSNENHTCNLKLYYLDNGEDQSADMNKTIEARINIIDPKNLNPYSNNTNSLAYNIINNALNVTNDEINNKYAAYRSSPLTKPAEEVSLEIESSLSESPDDYTDETGFNSYYFRGNVENNYVNFAGMCWNIVRIEGNGSVKLVLDDYYAECNDKETVNTTAIYTGDYSIGNGTFGYESPVVNGVLIGKINYLEPVADASNSMVKAYFDFQNTLNEKIVAVYANKKIDNYLKAGDWCLDDKAYASNNVDLPTATPLTSDEKNSKYLSLTSFYYDSYVRLSGDNGGYSPTFKCNGTIMDMFKNSTVTTEDKMYAGGITADEVVYAGGGRSTNRYYLVKNQNSLGFATLSPSFFFKESEGDFTFTVASVGTLLNDIIVFFPSEIRPSISLLPGVELDSSSGNGTINSPYIIK